MSNIKIIIVDKCGTLKETTIKDFREDKLYKKCGFKTIQGFEPYGDWCVKINNTNTTLMFMVRQMVKLVARINMIYHHQLTIHYSLVTA